MCEVPVGVVLGHSVAESSSLSYILYLTLTYVFPCGDTFQVMVNTQRIHKMPRHRYCLSLIGMHNCVMQPEFSSIRIHSPKVQQGTPDSLALSVRYDAIHDPGGTHDRVSPEHPVD